MNELKNDEQDDDDDDSEDAYIFSSDDEEDELDPRFDDDDDDDYNFKDALKSASNFKVRNRREKLNKNNKNYYKRKMMRADNRELDPEVRSNLSKANESFVQRSFPVAKELYLQVIKKDPKNFTAYKALGEIFQAQNKLNECCNYWLLAANIHPWDTDFWGQVAELSSELGHIDQAIYCYTRAITSDIKRSGGFILQRAILYQERKQYGKALEGFQKVRQLYPLDSNIIKHLASVYLEQKRLNDAINLYMKVLDYNINPKFEKVSSYPKFGFSELNILLELHLQNHSFRMGLNVLKLATRWIQNRTNEKWWDDKEDVEFDSEKRFEYLDNLANDERREEAKNKTYKLPIDIRFKLGCLRLGLGQPEQAILSFDYLIDDKEVPDLHFETGRLLEEHGYHDKALKFLITAVEDEEYSTNMDLIELLAKCYFETGDYEQSKDAYETLLTFDPHNLDFKILLAENLYHLGESAEAQKLINEVRETKPKLTRRGEEPKSYEFAENLSLIPNEYKVQNKKKRLTEQEKEELENNAKRKVLEKFSRMEKLQESMSNNTDPTAIAIAVEAWLQLASQLIEILTNVKSFFPKDKNKTFRGIFRYRRNKNMGLDEKLARAYNLLEGIVEEENYTRHTLTNKTEYRGLTYNQWFDVFARYSALVSRYENNYEYADEIINVALSVNVFTQDKKKETLLKALKLIFGVNRKLENSTTSNNIRNFLNNNQFSPFIYKLFMCCYNSGYLNWEQYSSYNHQKYFLRQLKSYDALYQNKHITGMATLTSPLKSSDVAQNHPELLYLYGNLLGGNKSYISSLYYLNRAYESYYKDPTLCLTLSLAHIHRSMQRLSSNRHVQLLQGFSYFFQYKSLRLANDSSIYALQEVEYNFGRLFHMLGLYTLAIRHYEKVLALKDDDNVSIDEDYDMCWEAAYNLSLIYNINGNHRLAKEIIDKYLTV
ncbi:hypothetical protein SBY92_000115 [Candida maltosa Xu316]